MDNTTSSTTAHLTDLHPAASGSLGSGTSLDNNLNADTASVASEGRSRAGLDVGQLKSLAEFRQRGNGANNMALLRRRLTLTSQWNSIDTVVTYREEASSTDSRLENMATATDSMLEDRAAAETSATDGVGIPSAGDDNKKVTVQIHPQQQQQRQKLQQEERQHPQLHEQQRHQQQHLNQQQQLPEEKEAGNSRIFGSEPTVLLLGRNHHDIGAEIVRWRSDEATAEVGVTPDDDLQPVSLSKEPIGGGQLEDILNPEADGGGPKGVARPVEDPLSVFFCKEGCFRSLFTM